jgi:hypothetical protein
LYQGVHASRGEHEVGSASRKSRHNHAPRTAQNLKNGNASKPNDTHRKWLGASVHVLMPFEVLCSAETLPALRLGTWERSIRYRKMGPCMSLEMRLSQVGLLADRANERPLV